VVGRRSDIVVESGRRAIVARARGIPIALDLVGMGLVTVLIACGDGGSGAPSDNAADPVQELLSLARASDPDERNLAISLCVIMAMAEQHGSDAANLVVKATAAQARGERPAADAMPALTAMILIALECTRHYEKRAAAHHLASAHHAQSESERFGGFIGREVPVEDIHGVP
jgi:hypothetical protein